MTTNSQAEYEEVVGSVAAWAASQSNVIAIGVVGSWARGNPRGDSDIDLVVLTDSKSAFTDKDDWVEEILGSDASIIRRAEWGPLTERRVVLASGVEVEFGFAEPSWANVDPLDTGTAQVASDNGLSIVYDPHRLLADLLSATR